MLIIKQTDESLNFTAYFKPTHTENYPKFGSVNPVNHKKAVVRSLVGRSLKICRDQDLLQ